MSAQPGKQVSYLPEYLIAAGYLVFFCLAFALCSAFYYITYMQTRPAPVINAFATSLPPTTPTAHLDPAKQQTSALHFKDDFSDDSHGWARTEDTYKEEVTLGKLLLESTEANYFAFAGCSACPDMTKPYYLQADFSTGAVTDKNYGIVFHLNDEDDGFYLFLINPESRKYYFYHHQGEDWSLRAAGDSAQIKSFPAVNTLGLYANGDRVEFYINGKIVDSYQETGYRFHEGYFSFYVDDAKFKLVIDNLAVYNVGA